MGSLTGPSPCADEWSQVRVRDLFVAELRRAARAAPLRRALGLGVTGVAATVIIAAARQADADASSVGDALDGLRAALPLVTAALAAVCAGRWVSSGTAASVMTWVGSRTLAAAVELAAIASVATFVGAGVWWAAVVAFSGHALAAGTSFAALGSAIGAGALVLVPSVLIAALSGAALGLTCRSASVALGLIGAWYVFVEPLARGALEPTLGRAMGWLLPVTALTQTSGVAITMSSGSTTNAWAIASCWAGGLTAAAVATFARRDLA